jgi:hypothetical protein
LYALINKDFQELIPFKYDYIEQVYGYEELYYFNVGGTAGYGEGGMIVAQGGKWGLMNSTGKVLIPPVFDKLELLEFNNKTTTMYFLANRGRKISDSEEPNIVGSCGIIDINGNEIIPFEYQDISIGVDNQFVVNKGGALEFGRWGYSFIQGGKWGVVDISNTIKIPIIYDDIYKMRQNYIVTKGSKKGGKKQGILSIDNKIITPINYDNISYDYSTENCFITCIGCKYYGEYDGPEMVYGGQWGAIQNNGKLILNNNFSEILTTNDSSLLILNTGKIYGSEFPGEVKYEGKYGLSDINGKLILPLKFDEISVETNFIFAKLQGKHLIYTKTGELFHDKKFEYLSALSNNFISYRLGEKNGILKPDGSELFPPKFWATKNEDGYSYDIGLEGPYFKIVEAGNYFYATENGDVFREE